MFLETKIPYRKIMKVRLLLLFLVLKYSMLSFGHKYNSNNNFTTTEYQPENAEEINSKMSLGSDILIPENRINSTDKGRQVLQVKNVLSMQGKNLSLPAKKISFVEIQQKFIKKVRNRIQKVYSNMKMEAQVYDRMFNLFENNPEEQIKILTHLEDIIHQYDVARDFANKGGINVLLSAFNSTDENIIAASLLVTGSALQGNPDVQDIAYDLHLDKALRRFFSHNSTVILSRAFYAISSYLRQNPAAQERFIKTGGFHDLLKAFNSSSISFKLKVKVLNIISDLVVEQQEALQNSDNLNATESDQISVLLIQDEIKKGDICSLIPQLLHINNLDIQQKVVTAMDTLFPICGDMYSKKAVYLRIGELLSQYQPVIKEEQKHSDDDFNAEYDSDIEFALYKQLSVLMDKIPKQEESLQNSRDDL